MGNACVAGEPLVVDDAGTLVLPHLTQYTHDPRNRQRTDRDIGVGIHRSGILSVYTYTHRTVFSF